MAKKIIDDKTVKKVADLIKIHIEAEQVHHFTEQLNTVLDAVEVLNDVDTKDVIVTSQTHNLENIMAEDEANDSLDMSKYKNTKNFNNKYFQVRKVI